MNGLLIPPNGGIKKIEFAKSKFFNVLASHLGSHASYLIVCDGASMWLKTDSQNPNSAFNIYASILAGFSVWGNVFITGFNGDKSLTKSSVKIIAEKIIGITTDEQNKILKDYL